MITALVLLAGLSTLSIGFILGAAVAAKRPVPGEDFSPLQTTVPESAQCSPVGTHLLAGAIGH